MRKCACPIGVNWNYRLLLNLWPWALSRPCSVQYMYILYMYNKEHTTSESLFFKESDNSCIKTVFFLRALSNIYGKNHLTVIWTQKTLTYFLLEKQKQQQAMIPNTSAQRNAPPAIPIPIIITLPRGNPIKKTLHEFQTTSLSQSINMQYVYSYV